MKTFNDLAKRLDTKVTSMETINIKINEHWLIEIYNSMQGEGYEVNLYSMKPEIRTIETVQFIPTLKHTSEVTQTMKRVFNLGKNNKPLNEIEGISWNHNVWTDYREYLDLLNAPLERV